MVNNTRNNTASYAGIPYDDINWYEINGQPFGTASLFNVIVFGDANNIIDTKGAMAVGGNFVSPRGLSVAYGNDLRLTGTGYSPNLVRFLVGGDIAMQGPLVVIGHVVAGGNFRAASGSTYMIGKDGTSRQPQMLSELYQAPRGSQYWRPSDRGNHYAISSYDVPRYIPADRIRADVDRFFEDAEESIGFYHDCIVNLEPNGTVTLNFHELILRGDNPNQNVFLIDVRPNGIINKEIRFEVPEGSVNIVKFRTGPNAHLQYGLMGAERLATRTLYVFEDAQNIHMEVPADIWGSILAPQAMFHAHRTGGHVSGNAALRSFAVNPNSGFEFHLFPFVGGINCGELLPAPPEEIPIPLPEPIPTPLPEPIPEPIPIPECPPCPEYPEQAPCPPCPVAEPCPVCPTCPEPEPCPVCPTCPEPEPCPICPTCPEPEPCPVCLPCPEPEPCPPCPPCPEQPVRVEYRPYPVRVPMPCPSMRVNVEYREAPCKQDCKIKPGIIMGCIWGCACCASHDFEVKLFRICDDNKVLLHCEMISCCGCFEFETPYDDCYYLEICPAVTNKKRCKPLLTLKNVGVSSLRVSC